MRSKINYSEITASISGDINTNLETINGNTIQTNNGDSDMGTLRVTLGDVNKRLGNVSDTYVSGTSRGLIICGLRNDNAATTLASVNNEYCPLAVNNKGQLLTNMTLSSVDTNFMQIKGQSVEVNSGINSDGVQRICLSTDDINSTMINKIDLPISSTYLNRKFFQLYQYIQYVDTSNWYVSYLNDSSSPINSTQILPPYIIYAKNMNAADNGKSVTLDYYNSSNLLTSTSVNLINDSTPVLITNDIRMIKSFYMTNDSINNNGTILLYYPTSISLLGIDYYTGFMSPNHRNVSNNITNGLPINSRFMLLNINVNCVGEYSNFVIFLLKFNTSGSIISSKILFQFTNDTNSIRTIDLRSLGWFNSGATGSIYSCLFIGSKAIYFTTSQNNATLEYVVEWP